MPVRLLYRDGSLIVCEKPVGISSETPGLPELIREQEGFPVLPVHRLDQTTGGVCVLARSPRACTALQKLFQQDQVVKEYLAVISGRPESESGSFFDLLYHDPKKNKTYVVDRLRKGVREASCEWHVVKSTEQPEGLLSLVCVRLHSGRTHQIRVQFASRQLPLAGDRRYGSRIRSAVPALWSARICFPHPFSPDQTVDVHSTPPDSFPWSCFHLSGISGKPESGHS